MIQCRPITLILIVLAISLVLALPSRAAQAAEQIVRVTLVSGAGEAEPLILVFAMNGGKADRARVLTPAAGDVRRSRGSISGGPVEVASTRLSSEGFSCTVTATPYTLNDEPVKPITLELQCKRSDNLLTGTYTAKSNGKQWEGYVTGMVQTQLPAAEAMFILLDTPYPGWNNSSRWNGSGSRGTALIKLVDGKPASIRTDLLYPRYSPWDEKNEKTQLLTVPGTDGDGVKLTVTPGTLLGDPSDLTGALTPQRVSLTWKTTTDDADTITLEGERFGSLFFGHYEKLKDGKPIGHRNNALGFIGTTTIKRPDLPNLTGNVTLKQRLEGHLNWLLWQDPAIAGPFAVGPLVHSVKTNGDKRYDNEPFNGAAPILAGVVGMKVLDDPVHTHRASEVALRGGAFLAALRRGPYHLPEYYKHDFFFTPPMGIAFVRLYEATGDKVWLDEAVRYAQTLRETQMKVGTWTWVADDDKTIGKSNHRNDRSWDNLPLHCADHLYFLGLLRKVGGVDDFKDVEDRAAVWLAKATLDPPVHQEIDYLWRDRRPGEARESSGPTWYLLYLAEFAEQVPADIAAKLHAHLAEHHLKREGKNAYLTDHYPRNPDGFPAASTMRYALVLTLLETRRAPGPNGLRQALLQSIASWQSRETGLIWAGDQPKDALAFARKDQHSYAFFKAEIAWNLYRLIEAEKK